MSRLNKQTDRRARGVVAGMVLAFVSVVAGFVPSVAVAQDTGFPQPISAKQMMADQLMAMAYTIFGRRSEPRPDQLERAKTLLDMAVELSPDDLGLWELRVGLATQMEDQAMLVEALKNYLRLEPNDDAAQLEFFKARLSGIESVDDYLEKLEAMLRDESAAQFSEALRSRLATLAAQAAQEIGDTGRFAAWLGYAVKVDSANPEAAKMMYQLAVDRGGTPPQVGAALVGLLKANPVDPGVRIQLGTLLMEQAVFEHALDQYTVSMELVDMQTKLQLISQLSLCLIAAGREDEVPPMLLELQLFLKQMADAQNPDLTLEEGAEPAAPSLDDLPPLPTTLEFARLILMHDNNPVAARESFERLQAAASSIEDAEERRESLRQLCWVGAVFNQDEAWVRQRIDALGPEDEYAQLASGWLALRNGDAEAAKAAFEALGEENLFARLGLASLPSLSDKKRAEALQEIVWDGPTSMGAIVAARRLNKMGEFVTATPEGVTIRRLVDDLPRQLWTPALTVSPWVRMKVDVSPGSFGYLQPMKAKVTIRNSTRVPLSIGPGAAMQPTLMVFCMPSIRNEPMGRTSPTFFNLGRRLTLQPNASIQTEVRLDRFDMGQLQALYPTATISFSTTSILDPRPLANGSIVQGPLGATAQVGSLQARGLPATASNLQLWMKDLDGTDPAVRATAITRLLVIARQPAESTETLDFRDKVRDRISQRYAESFDPLLKAWTVRFMLPDENGEPVAQRVIDLAQRSDDPLVRIIYLVMNASEPTSPALNDAIRHDDPLIRNFAQAMKTGMELDAKEQQEAEQQGQEVDPLDDIFGEMPTAEPAISPTTAEDSWLP